MSLVAKLLKLAKKSRIEAKPFGGLEYNYRSILSIHKQQSLDIAKVEITRNTIRKAVSTGFSARLAWQKPEYLLWTKMGLLVLWYNVHPLNHLLLISDKTVFGIC